MSSRVASLRLGAAVCPVLGLGEGRKTNPGMGAFLPDRGWTMGLKTLQVKEARSPSAPPRLTSARNAG
ncbi:hypothetical protein [Pelotomaculum propionicicum]|uniref:hypothetical protein n=1 Tax=Pelotomaculum propionicicum TaxID=258475 RepID=UPI001065F04C|nr:hypothetical protein [Pelotomaculum propionicicum]NLI13787.1 hypothetical protein [Peptococcaceae bacterium]